VWTVTIRDFRDFGVKFPQAQLYATFTNKFLRMVNAFRGTDGKLAYLSSIGWFVPSNLRSKKFLSMQMQCAHTDCLCIQSTAHALSPLKNEGTNSMFLVKENKMFVITLKATKAFLVHFFNVEN
jgi:hypothetical protein